MFTGLVQGIGKIKSLGDDRFSLNIKGEACHLIKSDLSIGDSVAVDGICLTVEEILTDGFVVTTSPETLQRTTLRQKTKTQDDVNLETSLRLGSKIGGHFVTGHIDGIGCLKESLMSQKAWEMTFTYPNHLMNQWQEYIAPFLVSKGSIAINGISLTISDCDSQGNWFKVAVIPHTYAETNLSSLKSGDLVNLESDILGKYVDRLISHRLGHYTQKKENITLNFLAENGYI
jgi:riboflavin synthase